MANPNAPDKRLICLEAGPLLCFGRAFRDNAKRYVLRDFIYQT